MSDNWVGFRSVPKGDPNRKLEKRKFEHTLSTGGPKIVNSFVKQDLFEVWFGDVTRFDARQGGRITFDREGRQYQGAFSRIQIPKLISIVTEFHGEIEMRLKEGRQTKVLLKFQKALLPTERDDWNSEIEKLQRKFLEAVS